MKFLKVFYDSFLETLSFKNWKREIRKTLRDKHLQMDNFQFFFQDKISRKMTKLVKFANIFAKNIIILWKTEKKQQIVWIFGGLNNGKLYWVLLGRNSRIAT